MSDIEDILWERFNEERGQFGASGSPARIAEALTGKLTSDESVERAALGIHASHDRGDWDEELPVVQDEYLDMARAALAAALGEGESNE